MIRKRAGRKREKMKDFMRSKVIEKRNEQKRNEQMKVRHALINFLQKESDIDKAEKSVKDKDTEDKR